MRGAPDQWTVGSLWLGDGGVYPGMGETVGLAGTSPERVTGGLYNDGGEVGDPPYDPYAMESFDASMGAGMRGGSGGYAPAPRSSGNPIDDGEEGNPLVGLGIFGAGALGFMWFLHRFRVGDNDKFRSIKGTIGDFAIIGVAGAFTIPLVKTSLTAFAEWTGWGLAADTATYVSGS
jgi:hypothetical protein